jgi:hypothetical protein
MRMAKSIAAQTKDDGRLRLLNGSNGTCDTSCAGLLCRRNEANGSDNTDNLGLRLRRHLKDPGTGGGTLRALGIPGDLGDQVAGNIMEDKVFRGLACFPIDSQVFPCRSCREQHGTEVFLAFHVGLEDQGYSVEAG